MKKPASVDEPKNPTVKADSRGGRRPGAGRPKHSGPYREPTTAVRIPRSLLPEVQMLLDRIASERRPSATGQPVAIDRPQRLAPDPPPLALPLFTSRVAAGSPAAADDHADAVLDLNTWLVNRPDNTFCVRVTGDSMIDAGIFPGDVLLVERAAEARHGQIVIAAVDGEFTVKRYYVDAGRVRLVAENPHYAPIDVTAATRFQLWGVVTGLVRQFR